MTIKKLAAGVIAISMLFSLTACKDKTEEEMITKDKESLMTLSDGFKFDEKSLCYAYDESTNSALAIDNGTFKFMSAQSGYKHEGTVDKNGTLFCSHDEDKDVTYFVASNTITINADNMACILTPVTPSAYAGYVQLINDKVYFHGEEPNSTDSDTNSKVETNDDADTDSSGKYKKAQIETETYTEPTKEEEKEIEKKDPTYRSRRAVLGEFSDPNGYINFNIIRADNHRDFIVSLTVDPDYPNFSSVFHDGTMYFAFKDGADFEHINLKGKEYSVVLSDRASNNGANKLIMEWSIVPGTMDTTMQLDCAIREIGSKEKDYSDVFVLYEN